MLKNSSDKDFPKILEFIESITVEGNRFRQQVLLSLAEIFNFEHCTFFLTDINQELINPITLNIDESYVHSYLKYYRHTDVFYIKQAQQAYLKNNVLYITDLMPYETYEKTEYYNDFLKQQGFYHELAIALLDGDRTIGAIGLFKPFANKFSTYEISILKMVSKYISRALRLNLINQRVQQQKEIHEQCNTNSPYGTIIFNQDLVVNYINPAAREFVRDILPKEGDPLTKFIKNTVLSIGELWLYGGNKSVLSPSLKEYEIWIHPLSHTVNIDESNRLFVLSITPETLPVRESEKNKLLLSRKSSLTSRELEILSYVRKGFTNEQIAKHLFITTATVKTHLQRVFKKMEVTNRTALCHKLDL